MDLETSEVKVCLKCGGQFLAGPRQRFCWPCIKGMVERRKKALAERQTDLFPESPTPPASAA